MSKIKNENMDEDFSLPRIVKTHCNEKIEICFYNADLDAEGNEVNDPQIAIGGKLYNFDQAKEIQKILNEYL